MEKTLLTDEQKEKIAKKVAARLEKEAQAKAEDDYEKKLVADAKRTQLMRDAKPGDPDAEGLVPVFINIARNGDCIRVDGTAYYPQRVYNVTPNLRDVLLEIMDRGRDHEEQINGKTARENMSRRQERTVV